VANLFAATSAAANTDVEQLGQAMKEAGPMAASLGISIEQTSAAIASLSNAGIKGSQAGTALKSMLGSMMQETKTGTAALAEMGLTYENINPAANSYADIMGTLAEKNMTASQAVAIFGKEQASAALAAVNGAKDLETLEEKITGTSKATEMSAQMTDNYNGAMEELSGAIEDAQITLGNAFLPSLTSGVKFLTNMTNAATDTAKAIGDLAGSWNDWVASSVSDSAELERQYEETNKGHWEMIAGDAVWIGEDFGKAISDGIKESDDLKTAAADALDTPEAKAAMGEAAWESAEEFSKEWVEGFQKAQGSRDIAKILAREATKGLESGDLTKNKHNVAGTAMTTLDNGLDIQIAYQGRGNNIMSRLFVDGQQIGGEVYGTREEGIRELLKKWKYDQGNVYELLDEAGNAAIWRSSQNVTHIADYIFDPETNIKSKVDELFKTIASALEDGKLKMGRGEQTDLLGLVQDLDWFKKYYPEEYKKIGGESIEALNDALRKGDLDKVMELKGKLAGEKFIDALTGTVLGKKEMASLADIIAKGGSGVTDLAKWKENVFLPELKNSFDTALDYANNYNAEDMAIASAWIDDKQALYEDHADWFKDWQRDLLAKNKAGIISDMELMDQWAKKYDSTTKTISSTQKSYPGDSGGLFYGEFVDPKATWRDFMTDEGGFAGPTELWAERQIEIEQRNQQIKASLAELEAVKHPLEFEANIDTAGAIDDITTIEQEAAGSNPTMTLLMDTRIAEDRWMDLYQLIQSTPVTMQVNLVLSTDAYGLRAMVRSEIAAAIAGA
jgi:hypothetical protein